MEPITLSFISKRSVTSAKFEGQQDKIFNERVTCQRDVTFSLVSHPNLFGDPFVAIAPRVLLAIRSEEFRLEIGTKIRKKLKKLNDIFV